MHVYGLALDLEYYIRGVHDTQHEVEQSVQPNPPVVARDMNGRKSSTDKSQKSIHSFFGQAQGGKPNPAAAVKPDPTPTTAAQSQQGKSGKGTKRNREADDDDDEIVCIDASPVSKPKSQQQPPVATEHTTAMATNTTNVSLYPTGASGIDLTQSTAGEVEQGVSHHVKVSQATAGQLDALELSREVVDQGVQGHSHHLKVKLPSIPARDPKRQQLATRKFAIKRQRFQLGEDQESCQKTAGKYTPLEKQVVELKKRNPGFVMLVEV